MREIKFRAWNRQMNRMEYFGLGDTVPYYYDENSNAIRYEVMQYTGLHDKNGKKAYSQDIASDGINPPFVIDLWNFPLMVRLSEIEFEIIGDIYSTPELLNK